MATTAPPTLALRRVGVGLAVGGVALLVLGRLVLPELAALLLVAVGLGAYFTERVRGAVPGVSVGLVAAGLLLVVDRELDPVGATVERSVGATLAIAAGVILATYLVESDLLGRGEE